MRQTFTLVLTVLATALTMLPSVAPAVVADAQSLDSDTELTLKNLYETTPAAKDPGQDAAGVLVFPDVFRWNTVRLQSGTGALLKGGMIAGYYTASSLAFGLQPGAVPFAAVLFLMTDSALSRLEQRGGWEVGKDPAVVVMRAGTPEAARRTTDTQAGTLGVTVGTMTAAPTARPDTYLFLVGDAGLTGVDREGWKVIKLGP